MRAREDSHTRSIKFFLLICLTIILGCTVYVAWIAWEERPSARRAYFIYSEQFEPVAATASDAVVTIRTTSVQDNGGQAVQIFNAGSGFIIDSSGYILSNEHVVHGVDEIRVILSDGRHFPARVVGSDARDDLAVLKVDAEGLPAVSLMLAEGLVPGQVVIALGNPMGSAQDGEAVVSFGQIVRLNQRLRNDIDAENDRYYDDLIQTDAITLPGSSGGPLINTQGKVIGINTAMGTSVESGRHFGFAIRITPRLIDKIEKLRVGQALEHAFLGVRPLELDEQTSKRMKLKDLSGALVVQTFTGLPAHNGGIRPGDVIVALDRQSINSPEDLFSTLHRCEPNQLVRIEWMRYIREEDRSIRLHSDVRLARRSSDDL